MPIDRHTLLPLGLDRAGAEVVGFPECLIVLSPTNHSGGKCILKHGMRNMGNAARTCIRYMKVTVPSDVEKACQEGPEVALNWNWHASLNKSC